MNLVAYDNVDSIVDKKRSWIDIRNKYLYTRQTVCRNYISFGKRFDANENRIIFFIILTDDEPLDRPSAKIIVTNNGCLKIGLKSIWEEIGFDKFTTNYLNINLKCVETADDGNIYEICPTY